ncbi:hypothetical protein BDU57DRAFT_436450 [Ampelomyces quisqualis]|uniref:N-acetyltransferase domain-containing protein n=1 Tax=Ampelomyces quisqualis TaxID=50730 RepID=A0A6A5R3C6_AMPQU|nr:hypothetical protein BDU57DRAFT_436450 [Ampelomyces quisqualis]
MQIPTALVKDTQEHTIQTLANCFNNDVFQRYLCCDFLQIPDSEFGLSVNRQAFGEFVPTLVSDGAVCVTEPGSGVASVWKLEDFTGQPPAVEEHYPRVLAQVENLVFQVKQRAIAPPRKMLHLILIANDRESVPSGGKKSSIKTVVMPMLAMAKENGWLAVLEASSPKSRDVYKYLGFEVMEEVHVGVGEVDREGRRKEGGEGVTMWAMVFGL